MGRSRLQLQYENECREWGEPTGLATSDAVVVSGVVMGEGAISGLFWQQRMPVQRGYHHPYTNLRSTPDLGPDLGRGGGGRRKTKTDALSVASRKDDSEGVGLVVRVNVQKST